MKASHRPPARRAQLPLAPLGGVRPRIEDLARGARHADDHSPARTDASTLTRATEIDHPEVQEATHRRLDSGVAGGGNSPGCPHEKSLIRDGRHTGAGIRSDKGGFPELLAIL